jgi:hypothetical protein
MLLVATCRQSLPPWPRPPQVRRRRRPIKRTGLNSDCAVEAGKHVLSVFDGAPVWENVVNKEVLG